MARKKKKPAVNASEITNLNREYQADCPIDSIQLHEDNPRQGDIGAIHSSIDANGFYGAALVQVSSRKILAGNHRYKTLKEKGAGTIPVIWIDCDDDTAKRIMVADNRTSDLADYNNQALADLLGQIKDDETGLDLHGTGWDEEDYARLLSDLSGEDDDDEGSNGGSSDIPDAFDVLVNCTSESQQAEVLEMLQAKGVNCRALIA